MYFIYKLVLVVYVVVSTLDEDCDDGGVARSGVKGGSITKIHNNICMYIDLYSIYIVVSMCLLILKLNISLG